MADLTLDEYRDLSKKEMIQFLKFEAWKMLHGGALEAKGPLNQGAGTSKAVSFSIKKCKKRICSMFFWKPAAPRP